MRYAWWHPQSLFCIFHTDNCPVAGQERYRAITSAYVFFLLHSPASLIVVLTQLLPWGSRRSPRLRYRQACNIRQRNTVVEGATRPRRLEHCHHARG